MRFFGAALDVWDIARVTDNSEVIRFENVLHFKCETLHEPEVGFHEFLMRLSSPVPLPRWATRHV